MMALWHTSKKLSSVIPVNPYVSAEPVSSRSEQTTHLTTPGINANLDAASRMPTELPASTEVMIPYDSVITCTAFIPSTCLTCLAISSTLPEAVSVNTSAVLATSVASSQHLPAPCSQVSKEERQGMLLLNLSTRTFLTFLFGCLVTCFRFPVIL